MPGGVVPVLETALELSPDVSKSRRGSHGWQQSAIPDEKQEAVDTGGSNGAKK